MYWHHSETSNNVKPDAVVRQGDTYIVSKDFREAEREIEGETVTVWEFMTCTMTASEYELYAKCIEQDNAIDELTIAILEG